MTRRLLSFNEQVIESKKRSDKSVADDDGRRPPMIELFFDTRRSAFWRNNKQIAYTAGRVSFFFTAIRWVRRILARVTNAFLFLSNLVKAIPFLFAYVCAARFSRACKKRKQ